MKLAAIRVEDDEVFEAVHATILRLYADGLIDGLASTTSMDYRGQGRIAESCGSDFFSLERERPDECPKGTCLPRR